MGSGWRFGRRRGRGMSRDRFRLMVLDRKTKTTRQLNSRKSLTAWIDEFTWAGQNSKEHSISPAHHAGPKNRSIYAGIGCRHIVRPNRGQGEFSEVTRHKGLVSSAVNCWDESRIGRLRSLPLT